MSRLLCIVRRQILYPLAEMVKGTNSLFWYRKIKEMNQWTPEQIKQWQTERLQQLVNQAYHHTVYYKRLFDSLSLRPEDIKSIEDLHKIPVLTKDDIRANYEEMIPDNLDNFKYRDCKTGGTTGTPMRFLCDENVWGYVTANKIVAWETTGYRFGERFLALGSASIFNKKAPLQRRVLDWIRNEKAVNSMSLDDSLCEDYLGKIRAQRIKYIYGYASALYLLAKYAHEHNVSTDSISAAFTTSENLTRPYREMIEKGFGCKVMDCYGAKDAGVTAYEITPGNYHLGYSSIAEIIDGFSDRQGTLVATNLLNLAFPILRYNFGDDAELDNECCVYNGQVIHQIFGRTSDVIRLANGHTLTSPGFTILMNKFCVIAYEISKVNDLEILLKLQVAADWNQDQEQILTEEMSRLAGKDCKISIKYVSEFKPLFNGKRRFFMNNN